jgi:hypothetical protein
MNIYQYFYVNAILIDRQVVTLTVSVTVWMQFRHSVHCPPDAENTSVIKAYTSISLQSKYVIRLPVTCNNSACIHTHMKYTYAYAEKCC